MQKDLSLFSHLPKLTRDFVGFAFYDIYNWLCMCGNIFTMRYQYIPEIAYEWQTILLNENLGQTEILFVMFRSSACGTCQASHMTHIERLSHASGPRSMGLTQHDIGHLRKTENNFAIIFNNDVAICSVIVYWRKTPRLPSSYGCNPLPIQSC
jgi:hypothetical protein